MKYRFINAGSVCEPVEGTLFLDVGNAIVQGVIDHHHPDAPKHSATCLVLENAQLIPAVVDEIVLHASPDLDCVASSYLANYYIEHRTFPSIAETLARFVDKMDFGYSAAHILSLHSLYAFIQQECKSDEEMVLRGHELIEQMSVTGFESGVLPEPLRKYAQEIEDDHKTYIDNYEGAQTFSCMLPLKNGTGSGKCKSIILKKPQSRLFKTWARNDTNHTNHGFELLIVQLHERRTVISVKPDGMFYLKGLGDRLNEAEKQKLEEIGVDVDGENRPGYNMPDPWYDGRNPSHNFTIIDSPRRGSELVLDDVLTIVKKYIEIV